LDHFSIDIPRESADPHYYGYGYGYGYSYSSGYGSRLDLGVPMGNDDYRHFELTLLQSWQLRQGSSQSFQFVHVAARQQRLITALAISGPRPRSYLAGLLWPENSETRALESLRVSVHIVSRQIPGLLVKDGALLSLSPHVDIDLQRVRAEIAELREVGFNGNAASCVRQLRDAELLPGCYDDWVLFEQARLRWDRLHALLHIARESLRRRDYQVVVEASRAAQELEPLHESAVRYLVQAERQRGIYASALRALEMFQTQLKQDIGLEPSKDLRRLIADLVTSQTVPD
jgi:DNA-binding SARP family transcriptional activator